MADKECANCRHSYRHNETGRSCIMPDCYRNYNHWEPVKPKKRGVSQMEENKQKREVGEGIIMDKIDLPQKICRTCCHSRHNNSSGKPCKIIGECKATASYPVGGSLWEPVRPKKIAKAKDCVSCRHSYRNSASGKFCQRACGDFKAWEPIKSKSETIKFRRYPPFTLPKKTCDGRPSKKTYVVASPGNPLFTKFYDTQSGATMKAIDMARSYPLVEFYVTKAIEMYHTEANPMIKEVL